MDQMIDDDDDERPAPGCPMCGGEPCLLGVLGSTVHLRCRACGWQFTEGELG